MMKIDVNGAHSTPLIEGRSMSKAIGEEINASGEKLKRAARAFESYFIQSLLKEMRGTIPKGGLLGGGSGKEIYDSLLDEALAGKISEQGGIGLARLLVQKLDGSSFQETLPISKISFYR